jgi:hypothetical protein
VRFLIDEMFPPAAAQQLREDGRHAAEHVRDVGLAGASDEEVVSFARAHEAAVVTENVADFASVPELVVVFVRKRDLPAGGAQASTLAALLRRWAADNPRPYLGHHWPR